MWEKFCQPLSRLFYVKHIFTIWNWHWRFFSQFSILRWIQKVPKDKTKNRRRLLLYVNENLPGKIMNTYKLNEYSETFLFELAYQIKSGYFWVIMSLPHRWWYFLRIFERFPWVHILKHKSLTLDNATYIILGK